MKNQLTFVTCVYDDLYGTEFGGRPHPRNKYYFGIESALKMGIPILIYTWQKDLHKILTHFENFFNDKQITDLIRVEPFDLNETELREIIKIEKNKNPKLPGDRCYDVMLGKFLMIKRAIESNFFESDYFFWIDAGLSSSSLFPNKYLDLFSKERRYSSCSLFTPKVPSHLINKSRDKILFLKLNTVGYWFDKSHLSEGDGGWYIIGGLFGGTKDKMKELCEESIESFLYHINDKNTLYTEEQILTILYSFNKDKFNVAEFDVWHHEDSGDWVKDKIIGKKNFYKIFEEFNL